MKKFWYVIKDYTEDDFSNAFVPPYTWKKYLDHERVAEAIAEEYYYDDPDDPSNFEIKIGVKDELNNIKWYEITAEADVNFYSQEIENESNKS